MQTFKVLKLGSRSAIVMAPEALEASEYHSAMTALQDFAQQEDPPLNIILIPGAEPVDGEEVTFVGGEAPIAAD